MGDAADNPTTASVRVVIDTAWLELLIDGEDTYYVTLYGQVIGSDFAEVPLDHPMEIRLGEYDPINWGLHVGPKAGSATMMTSDAVMSGILDVLQNPQIRRGALMAEVKVQGPPRSETERAFHSWGSCITELALEEAGPDLTKPQTTTPLEFDANLRAQVTLDQISIEANTLSLPGRVLQTAHVNIPELDALEITLTTVEAKRRLRISHRKAQLTWPMQGNDHHRLLEIIEQARNTGVLWIDIDTGRQPLEDDVHCWPVTDVSVVVQAV